MGASTCVSEEMNGNIYLFQAFNSIRMFASPFEKESILQGKNLAKYYFRVDSLPPTTPPHPHPFSKTDFVCMKEIRGFQNTVLILKHFGQSDTFVNYTMP